MQPLTESLQASHIPGHTHQLPNHCVCFLLGYDMVVATLSNLTATTNDLVTSGNMLTNTLQAITASLNGISTSSECMGSLVAICGTLPMANTFQAGANFNDVCDG